jgi:aspartyl-tRNA(Asn)/glutamyl-tRNA(Gln) amidotransferase subunit B
VDEIRAALPALPAARRAAVAEATGASHEDATLLVGRDLDGLVLAAAGEGAEPGRLLTHAINDLADGAGRLTAPAFAALVQLETGGELTATQAKDVLADLVASGGEPAAIAAAKGYEAMDTGELEALVDAAIADNADAWEKFCAGEDRVQGVFVGAVMKATRGQADGAAVTRILQSRRG